MGLHCKFKRIRIRITLCHKITNLHRMNRFSRSLRNPFQALLFLLALPALLPAQTLPHLNLKPTFSQPGGFYSNPFTLTLQSSDNTLSVWYTLDGTNPATSATAMKAGASVNVWIDPASSLARASTPAVTVRACLAGKAGYLPSFPLTHTYIFTEAAEHQGFPGGNWPTYNINGQIIDLAMDPKVTDDPQYHNLIEPSLKALPAVSLVTDNLSLFQPDSGIYVNAEGHGEAWERACSAEWIYPDGVGGFSVNAGLRIRGGWSRHDEFPKHSFRLFFNSAYGDDKLRFPLFGTEGTDVFDKIDIKTSQNYAWANDDAYAAHNSFVRESFSHDLQGELGRPYTRSRFCQLFLNGMYWGLYEAQERPEARFAESYLGGDREDYDVVKVNMEDYLYVLEATDGNLDTWQHVYDLCNAGFVSNASYHALEGRDASGNRVTAMPVYVDIDNLIDYMLILFYTGNFDAPTSAFRQNKNCNNFYAIRNRNNHSRGFVFFVHDAEHTLMAEAIVPGIGLYEDRVNLATREDALRMELYGFENFHPQWLHYRLSANADYRMRVADRAFRLLQPGNPLSPEAGLTRFNRRTAEAEEAIVAESARWGDAGRSFAYTRDDAWMHEINEVRNDFLPYRSSILRDQLKAGGLYPEIEPPVVRISSVEVVSAWYPFNQAVSVSVSRPSQNGTIYYTLNNSDPRLPGGQINPLALTSTQAVALNLTASKALKARMYYNGTWSALNHIDFLGQADDYSALKVTELMVNPADHINSGDTLKGSSLEFIEFKNTGSGFLNLSGFVLDTAVHATFPENTLLAPGDFLVAASKPFAFSSVYGREPSVNYSGNLSNSGEEVLLTRADGSPVLSFTYQTTAPWPEIPDGLGYSLAPVEINPTGDPSSLDYWRISKGSSGSPFADDTGISTDLPEQKPLLVSVYPNPVSSWLFVTLDGATAIPATLVLLDAKGRIAINTTFTGEARLNLNELNLDAGVYILRVETSQGIQTRKIVYLHP